MTTMITGEQDLCGLDGEQCKKSGGHVVVMELSSIPLAIVHLWRVKRVHAEPEELPPGASWHDLEAAVDQATHSEDGGENERLQKD